MHDVACTRIIANSVTLARSSVHAMAGGVGAAAVVALLALLLCGARVGDAVFLSDPTPTPPVPLPRQARTVAYKVLEKMPLVGFVDVDANVARLDAVNSSLGFNQTIQV